MPVEGPDYRDVRTVRVNADADGDNVILAGVPGKVIRVVGYDLTSTNAAAAIAVVKSSGGGVLAELQFAVNGGSSYAGSADSPAFDTVAGEGLVISCAVAQDVNGHLAYVLM